MKTYKDVPSYIAAAPDEARAMLRRMRAIIKALAPAAEEKIGYGMPGYKLHGRPLAYFAAFKDHVSFFPASGSFLKTFSSELKKYRTGKGTVQFPYGKPLPIALLRKLVRARAASVASAARTRNARRA